MSRLTINSNIASLNAQRYFGQATSKLTDSFVKLSSGLRINKASDDAAGLSVSSLLTADKRVTNVGIRNINDGISYLNVAESALSELSNIVTRISELAEQSANGTFGSSQRDALQQEVTSLESEYNRIIKTTSFNGNQLLTGTTTNTVLQGGYGLAGQLGVQVGDASLGIVGDETRAGLTTRVDTGVSGRVVDFLSNVSSISGDGRYIIFDSLDSNIVAGDTNGTMDSFLKDTQTGEITLIGTDSSGNQGNFEHRSAAISADGRFVAITSSSTNLVVGDTNGSSDAFIKDIQTGITTRVSTDSSGNQANNGSFVTSISGDGRYVVFRSNATNLVAGDANGTYDLFVKDTQTGAIKIVNTDSSGNQAGTAMVGLISADGRYVTFYSYATNLVPGDTNGIEDLFRKDLVTGAIARVNTDSSGNQATGASPGYVISAISSDGRFVAFTTTSTNLDADGAGSFIKDMQTGVLTRIDSDSSGNKANNISVVRNISADGRYVSFISYATNLVADDTNGVYDSFIKDTITGITTRISTDSSGNQSNYGSSVIGLSADGRYAVIQEETSGNYYLRDLKKAGVQEISGMVVSNQASARVTLDLSKKYQAELSKYQAGIGASLSRATTFVNTLQVQSDNYAAAASQITDVDVAEESSKLTASQIIQQAAASVLKQANLQPELVLSLLKGL